MVVIGYPHLIFMDIENKISVQQNLKVLKSNLNNASISSFLSQGDVSMRSPSADGSLTLHNRGTGV